MPETSGPARVVLLRYLCDECGAEMLANGYVLTCNPPLYGHRCRNNHQTTLERRYPSTDFIPEDAE